jgi:uncharacterized Zn-binding protein involved in type VI secretion
MSDVAEATGNLLNRAGQNAGKPASSGVDVWSHNVEGLKDQARNYDPANPPDVRQTLEALGQGIAGNWDSATWSGVGKGMAQQAGAIQKQLGQLFHVGNGPAPSGVLQHVGAAFGTLMSVEQLICMPLAKIPCPAIPAVRIMDFDIGLPHAHPHPPNTPPAPPIPLPSTGPVIPIPYVSGAGHVLINGRPAARCGDMGLGIWCGGYFPMYEIFLGSSNVWIEGARAARVGVDLTKHCIFTSPKPGKPQDAPIGPMFGMTISCSPNVSIGGIPMRSLTAKVMGAAMKVLFKGLGKALNLLRGAKARFFGGGRSFMMASAAVGKTDFVTLKSFQEANRLIDRLKEAEQLIIRSDNPAFVEAVESDLRLIGSSKTGRQVLQDLLDSGKQVKIKEGEPPCARPLSEADCAYDFAHPDGARPGPGSDSVIFYKPGEGPGPNSPSDTVLLHELGHSRNMARGTDVQAVDFPTQAENDNWSNLEEKDNITKTENPYRAERGLPERTGHNDVP